MGASQERADIFNATLLVVTRHPGGPTGRPKIHPALPRFALFSIFPYFFFFFFLTIQNITNRHVNNAFDLIAVFISFPLARAAAAVCCGSCGFLLLLLRAPTPPRPPLLGEGSAKKKKSPVASEMALVHVCFIVGVVEVAVLCKHYTG
jgi:hypothetical protein